MSEPESQGWHWADADGVVSIVDEWELLSSLSTGSLPHYILVWREGWSEWLPACQVSDFANALPKDKVEKSVEPKLDPKRVEPPPPPVDRYQAYQTRDAAARLLGKGPKRGTPVPPPGPGMKPMAGLPPPPVQPRPAQPTLVESAFVPATATLRPPGAVPPPPRPVPTASYEPPDPVPVVAVSPMIQVVDSGPPSAEPLTMPRAAGAPLPSWSDDLEADQRAKAAAAGPMAAPRTPAAYAAGPTAPRPGRPPILLLAALCVGGLALVGVVVVGVIAIRASRATTPSTGSAAAGGSPDARAPLVPCKRAKSAIELWPSIVPTIAPVLGAVPGSSKIAVGFATDERAAVGITVDPATLAVDRAFEQKSDHDISGVVPTTKSGSLAFVVDVDTKELRAPRTLDAKSKITLGWTESGLSRKSGAESPAIVWQGPSEKATDPRVAPLPGGGFAVTARRGGQSGNIVVGLTDDGAQRTTDLVEIATKPQVGSPAIAAGERGVLVAFAARPSDDSYWTMQLAAAPPGQVPHSSTGFATPPGGPGADAISPAVEALSNGRWLLQWTEGAVGRRQVRLQTLGFDLVPVGDPLTLSPEEANAGQGVVMVRDGKALSLFLVKKGKTHELWGASLSCP